MTRVLAIALLLLGCGGPGGAADARIEDSGSRDAFVVDTGAPDSSPVDAADSGPEHFGTISGPCGMLSEVVTDPAPSSFLVLLAFPPGGIDEDLLSPGAQRILMEPNAGGSSRVSEAMAYDVLERCEAATLLATENEVMYMTSMPDARTDLVVDVAATRLGVGVTRAFLFESMCVRSADYPATAARALLEDKLMDVIDSTMDVAESDRWQKQVVVVFAGSTGHAMTLSNTWEIIDPALRGDTLLYIIVTSGADNEIYFEDRCPP